ncbi:MAG: rhodanese-like domain-containing protein [Oscillospiraceae bacterium]|nr:rhodanese-like domain-containing protein [Oscillospiraceae bacterium]
MDSVQKAEINAGVAAAGTVEGSVLVDVRTEEEYAAGHIPGSRNVPSPYIQRLGDEITDLNTPLYIYCQSGGRSKRAARLLASVGYTNVTDLGGLCGWTGPLEK